MKEIEAYKAEREAAYKALEQQVKCQVPRAIRLVLIKLNPGVFKELI
jgi:hypothetical protein